MRNVSDKRCRENQNTHFVFNNNNKLISRAVRNNMEKYSQTAHRGQYNMTHAHGMLDDEGKNTNTHALLEYVILIVFPPQQ
jgi:hypothetical protein